MGVAAVIEGLMGGVFLRWGIPGLVTVVGGTAISIVMTGENMASDLTARTEAALAGAGYGWASVSFDARDAVITGTATDQQMIDAVTARVASVHGVRAVTSNLVLAEFVSPYPLTARKDSRGVAVSGGVPDEAARARIVLRIAAVDDGLRLLSGAPRRGAWEAAIDYGLSYLELFDEGEIKLADLELSISGRAGSQEAYDRLAALRHMDAPEGVRVASLQIAPPLASPFEWRASFDGALVTMSGYAPTEELAARLQNADLGGIPVSASLVLASGAPAEFDRNALLLLENLVRLEQGVGTISDGAFSLTGAPADQGIAERVTLAMTRAGANVRLDPPRVAQYEFAAKREGGAVSLDGFVPDAAMRDRLEALDGVDASGLELARGAPERFGSAVDFALEALARMSEGSAVIRGSVIALEGRAATLPDFAALEATIALGAPQGLILAPADIRPPLVDPFVWSAEKTGDGRIAISGFVPSQELRSSLAAATPELGADISVLADGAPADFQRVVPAALDVLRLLDTGKVAFDGKTWSVTGAVDTPRKATAAEAAFAAAGLRDAGWSYAVALPEPPAAATAGEVLDMAPAETIPVPDVAAAAGPAATPDAAPSDPAPAPPVPRNFAFVASKTLPGAVSFEGIVPADATRQWLGVIAGEVPTDSLEIGTGLPADFIPNADAGIRALTMLSDGQFGLDGDKWVLSGRAESEVERTAALAALDVLPSLAGWEIDVALLPPIEVCRRKVDAFASRNAILFQSGSARMTDASAPALDELAGYLAICPEATVHVEGHTDADGADDLNLVLSVARAEAVANALIARGVRAERLYAIGYGESLPIADNNTNAGKQANRRIVFTVLDEPM